MLFHIEVFRKAFLLKCHLYLEGTDEVFSLFFKKYLLGNICYLSKVLRFKTLLSCKRKMWNSSLSLTNLSKTFQKTTSEKLWVIKDIFMNTLHLNRKY